LAHLLGIAAPRPLTFFVWIMALATIVGFAIRCTLDGTTEGRVATSITYLVIGRCIFPLVYAVVNRSTRWERIA
jgi:hypothetical protein